MPLILLVLGACSDEAIFTEQGKGLIVEGYISSKEATRTTYKEDGKTLSVGWAASDTIGLIPAGSGRQYAYVAEESEGTTRFTPVSEEIPKGEGQIVYAYYPYNRESVDENSIRLLRTDFQEYNKIEEMDAMIADGKIENGRLTLKFHHLFAFLKIKLKTSGFQQRDDAWRYSLQLMSNRYYLCSEDITYDVKTGQLTKPSQGGNIIDYYIMAKDIEGTDEIDCYMAVFPSPGKDRLTLCMTSHEDLPIVMSRFTPDEGLKSGHVYELSVDTEEWIEVYDLQRQALIDFYNATGGDNWVNNENWCSERPLREWYGVYEYGGSVVQLQLPNNNLSGEIPESFKNLKYLNELYLRNNNLSGEIPESFEDLKCLQDLELSNNNLTGAFPVWPAFLPELSYFSFRKNHLFGKVPDEVLADKRWTQWRDMSMYNDEEYEFEFPIYRSSDYSKDKTLIPLQTHSRGKGIPIYILGEMYTDRDIADGVYHEDAEKAAEYFFEKEPYKSLRDCFDVICVNSVSETDFLGHGTLFDTGWEFERGTFYTKPNKVIEYINSIPQLSHDLSDVTVIVLMKTWALFRSNTFMYGDGMGLSFNKFRTTANPGDFDRHEDYYRQIIHHEVCGHAFGKLGDEYIEVPGSVLGNGDWLKISHENNQYMNVDDTNDPDKVVWSYFLNDPNYANERIGIYEGALYVEKGAYRATDNSIMTINYGRFNAPSRRSIYQRIMELAGETYRLEDFLEYDKKNLMEINAEAKRRSMIPNRCIIRNSGHDELCAPPRVYHYPSSEIVRH